MRRWKGAAVAAATVALVAPPTAAYAGGDAAAADGGVTTVIGGLEGPRQLDSFYPGHLLAAESDSGEISVLDLADGGVKTLFAVGPAGTVNPQGIGYGDGQLFIALGETGDPDNPGPPPDTTRPPTAPRCELSSALPPGPGLLVTTPEGKVLARCDLFAAELFFNPDGQVYFDPATGEQADSISNPYAVLVQDSRVLVADAGANTVWSIDRHNGEIAPFFALPVITGGVCGQTPNNTAPPSNSCDPTPTGVVEGPDGTLYVSGLSGLAQGEGRIYVLDQRGTVLRTIDQGLNPLTGIAVDGRGTIFASEIFGTVGAESFFTDPTQAAGRLVRIDGYGNRTYAPVGTPQGLEFVDGSLYAAALSLGPPPPAPPIGQVVRVGRDAFTPGT